MLRLLLALVATAIAARAEEPKTANAFSTALWFVQQYGDPAAVVPAKDRALKVKLIEALAQSQALPSSALPIPAESFQKLAKGPTITVARMIELLQTETPQSRKDLIAKTRQHLDLLTTQFDLVDETHREPAARLAEWIAKNYKPDQKLGVIVICTGNTRRSMLGATMGNLAVSYYGLPNVRFHSGGTTPDAINPRTLATLREIGLKIDATDRDAPSGPAGHANPIFHVQWGQGLEMTEFSKKYTDAANPQKDFAAILVCSEADTACPSVQGAGIRISAPFLDPKAFDGASFEAAKYAERRDDMGRVMLAATLQAKRLLEQNGTLKKSVPSP